MQKRASYLKEINIEETKIEETYVNHKSFIGPVTFVGESMILISWMGFEMASNYKKDGRKEL